VCLGVYKCLQECLHRLGNVTLLRLTPSSVRYPLMYRPLLWYTRSFLLPSVHICSSSYLHESRILNHAMVLIAWSFSCHFPSDNRLHCSSMMGFIRLLMDFLIFHKEQEPNKITPSNYRVHSFVCSWHYGGACHAIHDPVSPR
jgi:hypothetical protein